jgi:hypothetical protein
MDCFDPAARDRTANQHGMRYGVSGERLGGVFGGARDFQASINSIGRRT